MYSKLWQGSLAFTGLLGLVHTSPIEARDVTAANAENAYNQLQTWYNTSNGLWIPSTGWWNSANCLTVISNLAAVDGNLKSAVTNVLSQTYTKAQQYNGAQVAKVSGIANDQPFLPRTYYAHQYPEFPSWLNVKPASAQASGGFLNGYYDDEGWWALGWIAAYDLTGNTQYLSQAQTIFNDMNAVFGKTNCSTNSGGTGGIWWDKAHTYVNAIANELFLSVAAHLANRVQGGSVDYLSIAKQQWAWFKGSGMLNSGNTINDGLDQTTCKNNGGTVWSYNQGVVLGGLSELSKATNDNSYTTTATSIANAAISALAPSGILTDPCEPNCGADGTQFKGVFTRNLQVLQKAAPQSSWVTFLDNNANSIWNNDRENGYQLSVKWAGPFIAPANASTQSSAMDTIVASLAT
ncbi:glycoside hydrolase family 76 protein [Zasmidium cellare ATCC 36951]|uniref:Glycoside hydrolase family 76 protein n=1 Tax=Zasmidium cellare ATCC 36951 TaxID=1080233 RepID=A0A6A6BWJ6_ZASCE|nr:glycoside hydrolase family 76 protein [Zasmidium cellare ATCC 36951]KAF2159065.1 glycoside hydrolase family 76 protein [Zasmidium cellare ATCC 36951]